MYMLEKLCVLIIIVNTYTYSARYDGNLSLVEICSHFHNHQNFGNSHTRILILCHLRDCGPFHTHKHTAIILTLCNYFPSSHVGQNDVGGLLAYSLKVCMSLMQNKKFRNEVLRVLVKLYMNLEKPDFINVCQVNGA